MKNNHKNLIICNEYSIKNYLGFLRDKQTKTKDFRYYSQLLTTQLLNLAIAKNDLKRIPITTPLKKTIVWRTGKSYVLIIILRAGVAMLPAALSIFSDSKVGFVGLARDEKTAIAKEYCWRLPSLKNDNLLILDPMIATGGSLLHVLRKLKDESQTLTQVKIVSFVCSPEGVAAIHDQFPQVKIYTASLDEKLNSKKFIIPGLGDFGDRYFGTEGR